MIVSMKFEFDWINYTMELKDGWFVGRALTS